MKKLSLKNSVIPLFPLFFCSMISFYVLSSEAKEKTVQHAKEENQGAVTDGTDLDREAIQELLRPCGLEIEGPFHDEHGEGYLLRILNYKTAEQCGLKFNPYSHRIECYVFDYSGEYILQLLEDDVFVDNWSLLPKYFRVAGPMYSPELMEPQAE